VVANETVETQFPSLATSASSARAFLRAALETWRLDGFGDVTELLTDELVGNVVRHVGSPMTLRLVRHPDFIRVEVDDPSTNPPRLLHPDEETTRGRGIMLVNELASEWGIEIRPSGKTVWFEIDIRPTTDEARGDDRAL
jgi:anti-sigma regulatory factor (Ser/Thr protein kinase)